MAKTKSAHVPAVITRPTPPMPSISITLDLHPTAHGAGVSALQQAQGIVISDKASHEAARSSAKGWKGTRREVEAWYRDSMVTPLYKAYKWASEQMNVDLALFDQAIALEEGADIRYVREQERLERATAEAMRLEAEASEQRRRDEQAAHAEAEALKLEASTAVLSQREQIVVQAIVAKMGVSNVSSPADWLRACKVAGYKDPADTWPKLFQSKKITDAITAAVQAVQIRKTAEAAAQKPIIVETPEVESQIGKVGGTSMRTYYGCGTVDLKALVEAAIKDERFLLALQPNTVYLNAQAVALKENFERVYPMCKVTKRDGIAG